MGAPLAAVTGGTGFLGRHVVRALADGGWRVRVLCRRDPVHPLWRGLEPELALGDLEDAASLHRLCRGADAVIHAAGLVKARRDADLRAANVDGAGRLAAAARAAAAPGANLVHVSSLAAREPQLSAYARSKRDGEAAVLDAWGATARLVRPCAVYGPGDRETLALFRMAGGPLLPVPAAPASPRLRSLCQRPVLGSWCACGISDGSVKRGPDSIEPDKAGSVLACQDNGGLTELHVDFAGRPTRCGRLEDEMMRHLFGGVVYPDGAYSLGTGAAFCGCTPPMRDHQRQSLRTAHQRWSDGPGLAFAV